jgi:hypothetical protein
MEQKHTQTKAEMAIKMSFLEKENPGWENKQRNLQRIGT